MNQEYLDLAQKLKALVDRGEGGEKYNAKAALDKLMSQYGINEQDLANVKSEPYDFDYMKKEYEKLLIQIAANICGLKVQIFDYIHRKCQKQIICTAFQSIEIRAKFDFYRKLYDEEKEVLYLAFIHKHNLFPLDGKPADIKKMSKEEIEKSQRAGQMLYSLSSKSFHRQIESGGK